MLYCCKSIIFQKKFPIFADFEIKQHVCFSFRRIRRSNVSHHGINNNLFLCSMRIYSIIITILRTIFNIDLLSPSILIALFLDSGGSGSSVHSAVPSGIYSKVCSIFSYKTNGGRKVCFLFKLQHTGFVFSLNKSPSHDSTKFYWMWMRRKCNRIHLLKISRMRQVIKYRWFGSILIQLPLIFSMIGHYMLNRRSETC